MMRRIVFFFIGAAIGFVFSLVPGLADRTTAINMCRESCPDWFMLGSLLVYLTMPFIWGALLARVARVTPGRSPARLLTIAFGTSTVLMLAITWYGHHLQHG